MSEEFGARGPLCPLLYARLRAAFGSVKVANPGEELIVSCHRPLFGSEAGESKVQVDAPGEYYRVNCPFCGDSRYRLWVNHRWGDFTHLAVCYNENCLRDPDNRRTLRQRVFDWPGVVRLPTVPGTREEPALGVVTFPGVAVPLRQAGRTARGAEAVEYVRHRGYDPDFLTDRFGVGFVEHVNPDATQHLGMAGRIFIPVYMREALVGWQGRYVGEPSKSGPPKYLTRTGFAKRLALYNYDVASRHPAVVVVEGATKVWSTGPEAVALLGKTFSTPQKQLLASGWALRGGSLAVYLDGEVGDLTGSKDFQDLAGAFGGRAFQAPLQDGEAPDNYSPDVNRSYLATCAARAGVPLPGFQS